MRTRLEWPLNRTLSSAFLPAALDKQQPWTFLGIFQRPNATKTFYSSVRSVYVYHTRVSAGIAEIIAGHMPTTPPTLQQNADLRIKTCYIRRDELLCELRDELRRSKGFRSGNHTISDYFSKALFLGSLSLALSLSEMLRQWCKNRKTIVHSALNNGSYVACGVQMCVSSFTLCLPKNSCHGSHYKTNKQPDTMPVLEELA